MIPSRSSPIRCRLRLLAACAAVALGAGCASVNPVPGVQLPPRHAEIAVTNLTPHPWHLILRNPQGVNAVSVDVQPRETFAVTVPEGEYVVEQTLLATAASAPKREFKAAFAAGERYRWSLATLLATDEVVYP